ncbi:MAG: Protein translocase subunit SecE [Chloroflexi bacterium]|jgi:preprotein translocase subunit SecE|nr:Protein translocase subunit SecE [Chloroflexota bacterium]MDB5074570.1 Protein translocase subunit SecE [Chloroflexota bacterium]
MAGSSTNPASAPRAERQASLARYLRDSRIELKKVNWPTREQVINLTLVVVVVCVVIAAFLGGLDYLFASLVKLLAAK